MPPAQRRRRDAYGRIGESMRRSGGGETLTGELDARQYRGRNIMKIEIPYWIRIGNIVSQPCDNYPVEIVYIDYLRLDVYYWHPDAGEVFSRSLVDFVFGSYDWTEDDLEDFHYTDNVATRREVADYIEKIQREYLYMFL